MKKQKGIAQLLENLSHTSILKEYSPQERFLLSPIDYYKKHTFGNERFELPDMFKSFSVEPLREELEVLGSGVI